MNLKKMFSVRKGLVKLEDRLQTDSLSKASINHIWDCICKFLFSGLNNDLSDRVQTALGYRRHFLKTRPEFEFVLERIWTHLLDNPLDQIPNHFDEYLRLIRRYYFELKYNDIYDFLEFILAHLSNSEDFARHLNSIFEEDNIGYRIIGIVITDITSPIENEAVNEAINSPYQTANIHFSTALDLLYKTKPPDYRNSIKESISAVESAVKIITGKSNGTLADALKILENKKQIRPAFKEGMNKMYGFTSDSEGIRHGLMAEPNLTHSDARLFLIQCSAFVNYLKETNAGN